MITNPHAGRNEARYAPGDSDRHWHTTPLHILERVRLDLGGVIGLDPCTFADNPTGALEHYTVDVDGLVHDWHGAASVFVNPPYGAASEPWSRRCAEVGAAGVPTILLVPAATETRLFQSIVRTVSAVVFVHSRVPFGVRRANGRRATGSGGSALLGWNTALASCSELGVRMRVTP